MQPVWTGGRRWGRSRAPALLRAPKEQYVQLAPLLVPSLMHSLAGLIILEHELSTRSVGGFVRNYASLKSLGWNPQYAFPPLDDHEAELMGVGRSRTCSTCRGI